MIQATFRVNVQSPSEDLNRHIRVETRAGVSEKKESFAGASRDQIEGRTGFPSDPVYPENGSGTFYSFLGCGDDYE